MYKISIKLVILITLIVISGLSYSQNPTIATIKSMQVGDVACYVDWVSDKGKEYQNLANFDICDKKRLIGKRVNLFYEQANVIAASCNGDMDCRRTETVWIINKMKRISKVPQNQPSVVVSHCFQNEKIIFSCNTNSNKVISVCSSNKINRNKGYMQYRFGNVGSFPEFVFPMNQGKASDFFYSGNLTYSGGGGAYLKFINASYNYVVYTGIGRGWEKQGLVVKDGENEVSRYLCKGAWTSEMGPELFKKAGLVNDTYGFDIPVN